MKRIVRWVLFSFTLFPNFAGAQILPDGFAIEVFVEGILEPTQLDEAPDGRIFVAERTGKIRIVENGILLDEPFYEVDTETPGERGVTGLILHPEFDQNGYVYIYYTIPDTNRNRLIRVQASGNTASPDSEEEIFLLDPMWAAWHNGGGMAFDDEGYLILGVGDGTGWQSAEQMNTTLGKVLRLNDDGSIPVDNPFYDQTEEDQKAIWAIGIRNPYTMAKQNSTGRIFFNDVGNDEWEEVNEVIEGAHYGWGSIEGPIQPGQTAPEGYEDPLYAYDHDQGCAIVGAAFYEPETFVFPSEYHHRYFFMEYCQSRVYSMDPIDGSTSIFAEGLQYPNNIQTLRDGSILITEIYNGRILKISYSGDGLPNIVEQPHDLITIPNEDAEFVVLTLDQDELDFQWYLNGVEISGENNYSLIIENVDLDMNGDNFHCIVSNSQGSVETQSVQLQVLDETRPVVEIFEPNDMTVYNAGDTLWFSGEANDNEDGSINPENLEWNIFFHHNVHQHPALTALTGVSSGYYVIPDQGEVSTDVWFEVLLKATDSAGLENQKSVHVIPDIVEFIVDNEFSEMEYLVDGSKKNIGESIQSIRNMKRAIIMEDYHISNNKLYKFNSWSDQDTMPTFVLTSVDTILNPTYSIIHEYIEGTDSEDVFVSYYTGTSTDRELFRDSVASEIDENWSLKGPFKDEGFPEDNFSVVYNGSILAPYTGEYVLNILHDSFVRFEMEDSLLLESNVGNLTVNEEISIALEAGERYNFTLDYRHEIYFSRINLSWQFSELDNHTIPSTQLFAPYSLFSGTEYLDEIVVFPNPSSGHITIDFKEYLYTWIRDQGRHEVYDSRGSLLSNAFTGYGNNAIDLSRLTSGVYYLKLIANEDYRFIKVIIE